MKRKIIKQSGRAYTITLPINWIREQGIDEGDEIEITKNNNQLNLSTQKQKKEKTLISLNILEGRESSIRTQLINTYRAGFDVINLKFNGNSEDITTIVDTYMIGFEIFEKNKNNYVIESISEPDYDNFENIINRIFFILENILNNFSKQNISSNVHKIQKYDNFLKRCISKKIYNMKGNEYMWQFLSNLTQIARAIYHLSNDIKKYNIKQSDLTQEEEQILILSKMVEILKTSYLKKENKNLETLHNYYEQMENNIKTNIGKTTNPIVFHNLLLISRIIYLAGSPLTGYFHANSLLN